MCHTRIHADRDRHHESSMKEREENGWMRMPQWRMIEVTVAAI
jgi:hypothetical protein